jgi:hypothetical protein
VVLSAIAFVYIMPLSPGVKQREREAGQSHIRRHGENKGKINFETMSHIINTGAQ